MISALWLQSTEHGSQFQYARFETLRLHGFCIWFEVSCQLAYKNIGARPICPILKALYCTFLSIKCHMIQKTLANY